MIVLRFFDLGLVVLTAPVVIAAGLPLLGYLCAGGAWVITRLGAAYAEHRVAAADGAPAARLGVQVAGMMARVWFVVLAIVVARIAGDREDGIMAAALVLAAFTVYLATSVVVRQLERNVVRP